MSTDKADEQEAPGVRTSATDDEDTEGHVRTSKIGDPDLQQPSVRTSETSDEDDTEGHVRTSMRGDPDFGAQQPSVRTSETSDEDDTEGHVRTS
jgi:hypothetical protein